MRNESGRGGHGPWLVRRTVIFVLAVASHPIRYDMRIYELSASNPLLLYFVLLSLEISLFAYLAFYSDSIPIVRNMIKFGRDRRREGFRGGIVLVATVGMVTYLGISMLNLVRGSMPAGAVRQYADLAYFVCERLFLVIAFLMSFDDDDDNAGHRREIFHVVCQGLGFKRSTMIGEPRT